jgi:hypothetical protein
MILELLVFAFFWILLWLLISDWIYSRGYAKGWDDSVIHEYEKEFD